MCSLYSLYSLSVFFFFNDTATTEIYTLSLHDALPISAYTITVFRGTGGGSNGNFNAALSITTALPAGASASFRDRKSTRLNSSHSQISYAVFCLIKTTSIICPDVTSSGTQAAAIILTT